MPERKNNATSPERIAIIGGGRWARVLTEVLSGLVPRSVELTVHSRHNAASLSEWAVARGLERRIGISSELPCYGPGISNAAIVVNAARDHQKSVQQALEAGIHVLVEKPMALTAAAANHLAGLAAKQGVKLAAAHVFRFATYLDNYAKRVVKKGVMRSLHIIWTDPRSEHRYGEQKQFDSSTPILADCMPHIMSIISVLTHSRPTSYALRKFTRGGACLEIELMLENIPCTIQLERNSDRRRRTVEAETNDTTLLLDFTQEPGIIQDGLHTCSGDPDWETTQRPVARMLKAFLSWIADDKYDDRLDVNVGIHACHVIDNLMDPYQAAMRSWIAAKLDLRGPVDDDLHYALSEIVQSEGRLTSSALEQQVESVHQQLLSLSGKQLLERLTCAWGPADLLKDAAAVKNRI